MSNTINLRVEKRAIAVLLFHPNAMRLLKNASGDWFTDSIYNAIFESEVYLGKRDKTVAPSTAVERASANVPISNELYNDLNKTYLGLTEADKTQALYKAEELANRRKAMTVLTQMFAKVQDTETNYQELLTDTLSQLRNTSSSRKTILEGREVIKEAVMDARDVQSGKKVPALFTGLKQIDEKMGGYRNGSLNIVAAGTSVGKTAYALTVVKNVIQRQEIDRPVMFFSVELPSRDIGYRLMAGVTHRSVDYLKKQSTDWTNSEDVAKFVNKTMFNRKGEKFRSLKIIPFARSLDSIFEDVYLVAEESGVGFIVVDYLQMVQVKSKDTRNQQLDDITAAFKQLAMELDCPVMLLSQLNRAAEQNEIPQLSDLRDSGAIEQAADTVMFIKRKRDSKQAQMFLQKNRNGVPEQVFDFLYDNVSQTFIG